jgi:hypothetical protein
MHGIVGGKTVGMQWLFSLLDQLERKRKEKWVLNVVNVRKTIPFGMGRKAHGRIPLPWARLAGLSTFPGLIYTGWNSWWPVATDATVLSLPATTLTNMAPWFNGSLEISSYWSVETGDMQICIENTYCLLGGPIAGHDVGP